MKRQRIIKTTAALLAFSFVISCVAIGFALKNNQGIRSMLGTGQIKVAVNCFTEDNGKRQPLKKNMVVDAFSQLSYIPEIKNKGCEAYIRVKLTGISGKNQFNLASYMQDIDSSFIQVGEYLYSKEAFCTNEKKSLCRGLKMSEDWNIYESRDIEVKIEVEAIQGENFKPNFQSPEPWGSVEIIESKIKEGKNIKILQTAKNDSNIKVIYPENDLAVNIDYSMFLTGEIFMPGDIKKGYLTIENNSVKAAEIYMYTSYENSSLIDSLELKIQSDKAIYEGLLGNDRLKKPLKLLRLGPNEKRNVYFELLLPETIENQKQQLFNDILWCFTVHGDKKVKTSDEMNLGALGIITVISLVMSVYVLCRRKNEGN